MTRVETLNEAMNIIVGQRENEYGSPEDSFDLIARYWSAHLNCRVTATDVAAMMSLLKLARLSSDYTKADSWIDLAGYAACGCEIATKGRQSYNVRDEEAKKVVPARDVSWATMLGCHSKANSED